jgi:hypothetical protein
MNSRGQPTRGGIPAWGLGMGLRILHRKKNNLVMKCSKEHQTWMYFLDKQHKRQKNNSNKS